MESKVKTKDKLLEWFTAMGYDGKLPVSVDNICNPSTFFIWEQIMEKVKPKQDVEVCRRNIIMNRLKSKPLRRQDDFPYPINEIQTYIKKSKLKTDSEELQNAILEKETALDKLTQENKVKCALENNLKQKIKEYRERTYLLEKKAKLLECKITHSKEMLTHAKNLTPVELDENPETVEITETLQKCSEKLEKLINEMPHVVASDGTVSILGTAQKTGRKNMLSARKQFYSTTKKMQSMKKGKRTCTSAKTLYVEDIRLSTAFVSEVNGNRNTRNQSAILTEKFENMIPNDDVNTENQRESLGILPDACLDLPFGELLDDENVFRTPTKDIFVRVTSPQTSPKKPRTPRNNKLSAVSIICEDKSQQNMYEKLSKDKFVVESIEKLIHNHNRPAIWNSVETLCENLLSGMQNSVIQLGTSANSKDKVNENDIMNLHYIHIKTELDAMKYRLTSHELQQKIEKSKKQVMKTLLNNPLLRDKQNEVQRLMDLQIKKVKLEAVISCMKKEIGAARKLENSYELQLVNNKIRKVKQETLCKLNVIQEHMEEITRVFEAINRTRTDTTCCVRRVNRFISDMQWITPLMESFHSNEVATFTDFPIEYNRRFSYTEPKIFYRNVCSNIFPSYLNIGSDEVSMLVSLLENPFTPPENIIANILKAKLKLSVMNNMQDSLAGTTLTKHSYAQLKKRENYLQAALDKLNSILHSTANIQVFSSQVKMKETMELWKEMPFGQFISTERLVNDKTYSYYEDQFNSFYNGM